MINGIKSIENDEFEFIVITDCREHEIINAALDYIEEEKPNSILAIYPPQEYDLFEAYKWCKNLNQSDYGFILWPWLECEKKFAPPVGAVLSNFLNQPFQWKIGHGRLNGVNNVKFSVHKDEKIYLSNKNNPINIIKNRDFSCIISKQVKTLADNQLSHRRLLSHIKSKISKVGIDLLSSYDFYNQAFEAKFIKSCEYILQQIKEDQGINNYKVQVFESVKPKGVLAIINLVSMKEFLELEFKFSKEVYK